MQYNDRNGGFIKKSKDQFLREAGEEIAMLKATIKRMNEEAEAGGQQIEKMKWQIVQLRMGVAALATHAGHTPDQVKEIYEKYCEAEEAKVKDELLKETEEAKRKLREDLAAGKKIEFSSQPNPEAKPNGSN